MTQFMDKQIKLLYLRKVVELLKSGFSLEDAFIELKVPKIDQEYITKILQ